MARLYATLYERLVANTELANPDDANSCWLWKGCLHRHYPKITIRVNGKPKAFWAHRLMLEEVLDAVFPFDEGAHKCYDTRCINPAHLEVQTRAHNLAERRGYVMPKDGKSWIPVLFPRSEVVEEMFDTPGVFGGPCPF